MWKRTTDERCQVMAKAHIAFGAAEGSVVPAPLVAPVVLI